MGVEGPRGGPAEPRGLKGITRCQQESSLPIRVICVIRGLIFFSLISPVIP